MRRNFIFYDTVSSNFFSETRRRTVRGARIRWLTNNNKQYNLSCSNTYLSPKGETEQLLEKTRSENGISWVSVCKKWEKEQRESNGIEGSCVLEFRHGNSFKILLFFWTWQRLNFFDPKDSKSAGKSVKWSGKKALLKAGLFFRISVFVNH